MEGAHVFHLHAEDEERVANKVAMDRDNARLGRIWRHQRHALRRQYRRTSFRYFRDLEMRRSEAWGSSRALAVPMDGDKPAQPPDRPHRVKARWWWLGV